MGYKIHCSIVHGLNPESQNYLHTHASAPQYIILWFPQHIKEDGSCPEKTYSCTYQTHISKTRPV